MVVFLRQSATQTELAKNVGQQQQQHGLQPLCQPRDLCQSVAGHLLGILHLPGAHVTHAARE